MTRLLTDRQELRDLRDALKMTQVQMAAAIEMPIRTYQTLENGESNVKPWHLKAARYAAIEYSIEHGVVGLLPRDIIERSLHVTQLAVEAGRIKPPQW